MIDTTKTYQTRNGRPARFLATVNSGRFPHIFAITNPDGDEVPYSYTDAGNYYFGEADDEHDLVEVIPAVYKLVYKDGVIIGREGHGHAWHPNKDNLDRHHDGRGRAGWLVKTGDEITWEAIS